MVPTLLQLAAVMPVAGNEEEPSGSGEPGMSVWGKDGSHLASPGERNFLPLELEDTRKGNKMKTICLPWRDGASG